MSVTHPDLHSFPTRRSSDLSILESYLGALKAARRLIYLENQFLWSPEVAAVLADKLRHPPDPDFRLLLVLPAKDRKSTRLNSSHMSISYAVFCLQKKI